MKQLFKKLDQQEEELTKMQVKLDRILQATDFLMSRAKGEDVEEVKKLYLVRDSEHD